MGIALSIIVFLLVLILIWGIIIYNGLVRLKHNVSQSWSNIDVLLRQRHDELPKLVETARQYMHYERDTLERVMEARAAVNDAQQRGDVGALGGAEQSLRLGLGNLFAVAEAIPSSRPTRPSSTCSSASAGWKTRSPTGASSTTPQSTPTTSASNSFPTSWLPSCSASAPSACSSSIARPPRMST